jgi:hypothetical protein
VPRLSARLAAACLTAGVLTVTSQPASAQTRAELPASVVEAGTIGGAERTQIEQFIGGLAPAATGEDAEAAARARKELVSPLVSRQPSVAFRQAYAQAVGSLMGALIGSEDPGARIAGLRIAGNLATADSIGTVRNALSGDDAGVRLFAAVQARRIFEVTGAAGPAITESQTIQLIDALAASVQGDAQPAYTQAVLRALGGAAQLRIRELGNTRSRALEALARVASERVRAIDPAGALDHETTVLLATSIATRSVSEAGVGVDDAAARAAAGLGGDILSVVLRRHSGQMMGDDLSGDLRLINAAESLIYFARRRHAENNRGNVNAIPQTGLAELLSSQDRGFRNELVRLIGPGSELLRQFGLPDDRFIR